MPDKDNDASRPSSSRRLFMVIRRGALIVFFLNLIGLILRFYPNDKYFLTEWLLWVPLIAWLIIGVVTAPFLPWKWGRRSLSLVLLTAIFAGFLYLSFRREQPRWIHAGTIPMEDHYTLVAWNVMSYNRGKSKVLDGFKQHTPDIICLSEGTYRQRPPAFLEHGLETPYEWAATRQLAMGSRFPILESQEIACDTRLRVFQVTMEIEHQPISVLLVDLPSPPRRDTSELFTELWAVVASIDHPCIVVGDFNTPRGSWQLSHATEGLTDFYTSVPGQAWLASWPAAFPLYQIDHAFATPGIEPHTAHFEDKVGSDHLRQVLTFRLAAVRGNEAEDQNREGAHTPDAE